MKRFSLSPNWLAAAALLLIGALYAMAYFKLYSRWWFEDDPALFAYAGGIGNPITIFVDANVVRHFTTGKALVPMQIFSYWMDVRVAGFSPQFAYAHQVGSFLLTLVLLYLILVHLLQGDRLTAFLLAAGWAMLPATAVVLQFLSTRHYLEGLMFSTFSIFILERGSAGKTKLPRSAQIAALLSVAAALLCKEIYVAVLPPVLLLYSWRFRERALGIATVVIVCGYIVYRDWMIGPAFAYNMPFLRPGQYLAFLAKLPYTISANDGGYLICGILLVLVVLFYRGGTKHSVSILLGFLALFAFSLAAVFPVSLPLYGTVRLPGTWYRIVFIPHTIALICLGYLTVRSVSRRIRTAIAVILLVVLLPGLDKTRRFWVERTTSAEREGKFYLQNPDKVLLSEQEAWWFIPGIQAMYNVSPPHYVFAKDLQNGQAIPPTVWRFRNGQFVPQDSQ